MAENNEVASSEWDVVIVGGGPAGSTAATLLKKYEPSLRVLVLEKARFPRDHIGESQLPSISPILKEMDVWNQVEAAGFPIKLGASYTWGRNDDRWDFDFYPIEKWQNEARPAKFEGQRTFTAFQVDRSLYDTILLDHAASLGATVRQETKVAEILIENADAEPAQRRIAGFKLSDGSTVRGTYYIDASGTIGLLRRALGVGSEAPMELRNIAVWDYWQNAEWALEIGVGGTRIQIRSLPYGWIWFIPVGETRTSIGLVVPAEYYKKTGKRPEELYHEALQSQPDIAKLIENATVEQKLETCKDWSHLADRVAGPNWFLTGEAAGFADPILSAGMSLAHSSARDAAYTILTMARGELDRDWLIDRFDERTRTNIRQHIRFAQYWYSANSCFTDLKENCQAIAAEAGLKLSPQQAWAWLSQGGFTTEKLGLPTAGSFDLASAKQIIELFDEKHGKCGWLADGYNEFTLSIEGAREGFIGELKDGKIAQIPCYIRDDGGTERRLPLAGLYGDLVKILRKENDAQTIYQGLVNALGGKVRPQDINLHVGFYFQALDALIQEHWVKRKRNPKRPTMRLGHSSQYIRQSTASNAALAAAGKADLVKSRID